MNPAEYRKAYEEELQNTASAQPMDTRLLNALQAAPQNMGGASLASATPVVTTVMQVVTVVLNRAMDEATRVAGLSYLSEAIAANEELMDMTIRILADDTEPGGLKRAALVVMEQSSFHSPIFLSRRPEYLQALRSLADHPDRELREHAIRVLAANHDDYVQHRLVEGLQDPDKALVPPEKGLQFLGLDLHAQHFPLLQKIVGDPPNIESKREAVRLLASDASSVDLLTDLLKNKEEDRDIRNTSAVALQSLAPESFADRAKEIVLDDDDDDRVRATCLTALSMQEGPQTYSLDQEFMQQVEKLTEKNVSEELERVASQVVSARAKDQRNYNLHEDAEEEPA